MPVVIGALRERAAQEARVSLVPEVAGKLQQAGAQILIERGAAVSARFPDSAFSGVAWADSDSDVLSRADVVLTVRRPVFALMPPCSS